MHTAGMNVVTKAVQDLISLGMTQTEIARQAGLAQCTVSRWLAGAVSPGALSAAAILQLAASKAPPQAAAPTRRGAPRKSAAAAL